MKFSKQFLGGRGAILAAFCSVTLCSPVLADQLFVASDGSASADFTAGSGTLSLVLTSNVSNPPSIAQLLSDISFSVSGGQSVTTTTSTPTGSLIHCGDGGCTSASGSANPWTFGNNAAGLDNGPIGTGAYLLTALVGNNKTLIIGPTTASYCNPNCPDGIGSTNFNTFLQPSGTFTLAIAGVTADSKVSDVMFSFGTAPETLVGVPIPAAAWLFGSGLLGLIGIARRRIRGTASLAPA